MRPAALVLCVTALLAMAVVSRAGDDTLEGTLSAGGDATKPFVLKFTLKNLGSQGIDVLKWGTPFEGKFNTRLFTVLDKDGQPAAYRGPIKRRDLNALKPDNILHLDAGATRDAMVDLSVAYGLHKGRNNVSINFDITLIKFKTDNNKITITDTDVYPLDGFMMVDMDQEVLAQREKKDAQGPQMALLEQQNTHQLKSLHRNSAKLRVTYHGCAGPQDAKAKAGVAAFQLAVNEINTYINLDCLWDPRFMKWFGTNDVGRRATAKAVINAVHAGAANIRVNCGGADCDPGDYAYVDPSDVARNVYLCDSYFTAGVGGINSQAGTFMHELSHFERTDDHVYGTAAAQRLAHSRPARAVNNADNFEYFMEDGAIPNACPVPPAVAACGGGERSFVSTPLDCAEVHRATIVQRPTLTEAGAAATITKNLRASSVEAGLWFDINRLYNFFSVRSGTSVAIEGAQLTPANAGARICCVKACLNANNDILSVHAFARDAGRAKCKADAAAADA